MYSNFYGFSEKPFDLTPDPKFLYLNELYREVLASLIYGIRERRGFITIVGEVGTGKTTLLNAMLDRLDEHTKVACIFNTDVTFEQLLNMALLDLGLARPDEAISKVEMLHRLNEYTIQMLAQGDNVVLIVDEAQNLDFRAMEKLRLLSNLETRKHKLIQIVLSGQPELDAKLNDPQLRQLTQRISLKRYITHLSEKETYNYIKHRLAIAEYKGPSLFNRKAQEMIWQCSGGVPRKINMLCDNALLIGYGLKKKKIKEDVVEEAIKDLTWSPFSGTAKLPITIQAEQYKTKLKKAFLAPRFALIVCLAFLACLSFAGGLFVKGKENSLRGERGLTSHNGARAKIGAQSNSSDKSFAKTLPVPPVRTSVKAQVALGSVPGETTEHIPNAVVEQIQNQEKSTPVFSETEKEKADTSSGAVSSKKEEVASQPPRVVVIKSGDTLFNIIKQCFGRYDITLLNSVMRANPDISDPDQVFVGQLVKLPESIL